MKSSGLSRLALYLLSVLRIVVAGLFIAHGAQKLFAYPASSPRPTVPLQSKLGVAGVLETGGGALMLVGLFSRPVALVLSGEMAFAYFTQHAPNGRWPASERRRAGGFVLFHLAVFRRRGTGPTQPGRGYPQRA